MIPNNIEIIQNSNEPSPDGGGYNDWPKHAKKLSKEDAQKAIREMLFTFSPMGTECRQAHKKGNDRKFYTLRIFWRYDKTGLMAVQIHDYVDGEYIYKIKWYHIGCEHNYVELSREECQRLKTYHGGNCYHVQKCKKCGHVESYDSSG